MEPVEKSQELIMSFHLKSSNILDTIEMIEKYRLDIRTVMMGISLLPSRASHLVEVCQGIEAELGIPIVNKRISVTPVALITAGVEGNPADVARAFDRAACEVGGDFLGEYSALVAKGATTSEKTLIRSIPEALSETDLVCFSVNIATSRTGIHMDGAAALGRVIKQDTELTADPNNIVCTKLVFFANSVGDTPFIPVPVHGLRN